MAGIGGSKSLAHEHVAQVAAAFGAFNFDPVTVRIRQVVDCPFHLFVESGPTAMGIEFVDGPVEFGVALSADVITLFVEVIICTCEGPFCPLVLDYVLLFSGQRVIAWVGHINSLPFLNRRTHEGRFSSDSTPLIPHLVKFSHDDLQPFKPAPVYWI